MVLTDKEKLAIFGKLEEILERVTRLETRMVRLMRFLGSDTQGKPVAPQDE